MKVAILTSSVNKTDKRGLYNEQDIGLAKELGKYCNNVIVYRLNIVSQCANIKKEKITSNVELVILCSKCIGTNGIVNYKHLDNTVDALIHFSDVQICTPKVYKWAKKHGVNYFPYIGVVESHSANKLKKTIMDFFFKRNLTVYKKCHCFVKTPTVAQELSQKGVNDVTIAPVGLDLSLLHQNYKDSDKRELKLKYDFRQEDKVILFIGRLIEEKQPIKMVEIFSQLYKKDSHYRLLMVGSGPLKAAVDELIKNKNLSVVVKQINSIPNSDIWELYRFAECFVNLNRQEIFGMAILEAMYYGCKVIAWHAPGPDFIIEDGISGYLVSTDAETCERVMNTNSLSQDSHQRILEYFTWKFAAKIIRNEMVKK